MSELPPCADIFMLFTIEEERDGWARDLYVRADMKEHIHGCTFCQRRMLTVLKDIYEDVTGVDLLEQDQSTMDRIN